ncbi:daunorubicin resistance protein DrrA family ABC transporter ATP-binding protein [Paenibacillus sp. 32O-W]|nr:daunorubicin resistance protein DrrA family ABC transporter ATP-binding protein [Paenibacillus sp. 32O-W]
MGEVMISVRELRKAYGDRTVLDGLSFEVECGTIFALLGENGAGKTTTVRILSTLIQPDAGKATIAGHDCIKNAAAIRKIISLTGQYTAVDEQLTGEENLRMMGRLSRLDRHTIKKRTAELLQQFDLEEAAGRQVKTYSGGMRRRLDIAVSLLASPSIIFLDEPTTGLDPRSRMRLWDTIRQLAQSGTTILLTTQYLEEADKLADRIAVMNGGRIVAEGTAEELKRIVGSEWIELIFRHRDDLAKARALVNGQPDETRNTIAVPSDGSAESLRRLLNGLHERGIEPASVQLRKPTLDDVFMQMTGRQKEAVSV